VSKKLSPNLKTTKRDAEKVTLAIRRLGRVSKGATTTMIEHGTEVD
jgi:hypothetical protein